MEQFTLSASSKPVFTPPESISGNISSTSQTNDNPNSTSTASAIFGGPMILESAIFSSTSPDKANVDSTPAPESINSIYTPVADRSASTPSSDSGSATNAAVSWSTADHTPPGYDMKSDEQQVLQLAEKAYVIHFVTPMLLDGQRNHRANLLIAKDAFTTVVRKKPEDANWLQYVLSEAKPIIKHYSNEWSPLVLPKIMKTDSSNVYAQRLSERKIMSEVFASSKTVTESPLASRTKTAAASPPVASHGIIDNISKSLSLRKKRSNESKKSAHVMAPTPAHVNDIADTNGVVRRAIDKINVEPTVIPSTDTPGLKLVAPTISVTTIGAKPAISAPTPPAQIKEPAIKLSFTPSVEPVGEVKKEPPGVFLIATTETKPTAEDARKLPAASTTAVVVAPFHEQSFPKQTSIQKFHYEPISSSSAILDDEYFYRLIGTMNSLASLQPVDNNTPVCLDCGHLKLSSSKRKHNVQNSQLL